METPEEQQQNHEEQNHEEANLGNWAFLIVTYWS